MKITLKGPGRLELVLDSSEVFPDDPGNGTPAMVYLRDKKGSIVADATFWCAQSEGELCDNHARMVPLHTKQLDWLNSMEPEVDKLYG